MSNYRRLLVLCVKALSTFDPSTTGVDEHLTSFLESPECKDLSTDADRTFIREVFSGSTRYRELTKVVVNGFYSSPEGQNCLRADSYLYHVLSYLLLFRLDELGISHWKRLVNSQHTGKMYKFLSYVFKDSNLKGWIRAEWYKAYDPQFVDSTILPPLLRFEPEIRKHLEQLSDRLANREQNKPPTKSLTEPAPFNLTKPHPRSVPTPDKIPTLKVYKPVPQSTYSKPAEQDRLVEAFRANKAKAQVTLAEADRTQFTCANAEKSEKTKAKIEQIILEREAQLQYSPRKPGPAPSSMGESRPVKLNAAAVLREGARVQREEEEEEKRLASLEAGEKDASEFIRWQEEMKQREAAEKLAEVERKHLEGQLSYEEAIIARQTHVRDTRERVMAMKEESEALMQDYFAQREEERRELRRLVEATMASHHSTREARSQLQKMKRNIVQGVAQESRELMARALEEAEAEMRRKVELIQQIRAMESVPVMRAKFVDLTETGGQGLLSEMSVTELRERLALLKVAEAEEEERKRQEIAATKQAKEELLAETARNISRHRKEQSRQTISKQKWQEQVFTKHHSDLREKKISHLQEKLEARRKERERLKSEGHKQTTANRRPEQRQELSPLSPPQPITNLLLQATCSNHN